MEERLSHPMRLCIGPQKVVVGKLGPGCFNHIKTLWIAQWSRCGYNKRRKYLLIYTLDEIVWLDYTICRCLVSCAEINAHIAVLTIVFLQYQSAK